MIVQLILFQNRKLNIDITGVDLSLKMLEKAETRCCYKSLVNLDIHHELGFPSNSYDYLICIGTTSHLGKYLKLNKAYFTSSYLTSCLFFVNECYLNLK